MLSVGRVSSFTSPLYPSSCLLCRIWPQYVKDRIHSTYMYFAGSVGFTALSAVLVSRTPALMGLMMRGSWLVSQPLSSMQCPGYDHLLSTYLPALVCLSLLQTRLVYLVW